MEHPLTNTQFAHLVDRLTSQTTSVILMTYGTALRVPWYRSWWEEYGRPRKEKKHACRVNASSFGWLCDWFVGVLIVLNASCNNAKESITSQLSKAGLVGNQIEHVVNLWNSRKLKLWKVNKRLILRLNPVQRRPWVLSVNNVNDESTARTRRPVLCTSMKS